jgi:hypothetical protein
VELTALEPDRGRVPGGMMRLTARCEFGEERRIHLAEVPSADYPVGRLLPEDGLAGEPARFWGLTAGGWAFLFFATASLLAGWLAGAALHALGARLFSGG